MADHDDDGTAAGPRRRRQGELEIQVLAALRQAPGPVNTAWVQDRLGGTLAYTTVITILTRLRAKGAVTRERAGRSFAWTATADEAGLAALRMRKVLEGETDREAVLASFVTGLAPGDEELLRGLLARTGEEGGRRTAGAPLPGEEDGRRTAGAPLPGDEDDGGR